MNPIYFSTILLQPNHWKRDQPKQVAISNWLDRIADAGFDGVELFELHFLLASTSERNSILAHPIAKPVFNSYLSWRPF
jgi:sugar phosphate isomerase/epimerase